MQDAFAYCAELVRDGRPGSLSRHAVRAGGASRRAVCALCLQCRDGARARGGARAAARRNPPAMVDAMCSTASARGGERQSGRGGAACRPSSATGLRRQRCIDLIEARRFDLYDEPMASDRRSRSLCARDVVGADSRWRRKFSAACGAGEVAEPAGIALAIAALLRAFPLHAARRQLYVPIEILDRHGVCREDIFAGRSTARLQGGAWRSCAISRAAISPRPTRVVALPPRGLPAFLPARAGAADARSPGAQRCRSRPRKCRHGGGNG